MSLTVPFKKLIWFKKAKYKHARMQRNLVWDLWRKIFFWGGAGVLRNSNTKLRSSMQLTCTYEIKLKIKAQDTRDAIFHANCTRDLFGWMLMSQSMTGKSR